MQVAIDGSLYSYDADAGRTSVLDRYGIVFGRHDLPFPIASKPCVGPNKVTLAAPFTSPGFAALNDRGVPEKPYVGVVEMI